MKTIELYLAEPTTNDEIGCYPQGHLIDEERNIIQLEKRAKLTDLLSVTNHHKNHQLCLSERAVLALSAYWSPEIVKRRRVYFADYAGSETYYLVEFIQGIETLIDFDRSQFTIEDTVESEVFNLEGGDYNSYLRLKGEVFMGETKVFPKWSHLVCVKIVLKSLFGYSIVSIAVNESFIPNPGILVTPEVYRFILKNKLTGFDFTPFCVSLL